MMMMLMMILRAGNTFVLLEKRFIADVMSSSTVGLMTFKSIERPKMGGAQMKPTNRMGTGLCVAWHIITHKAVKQLPKRSIFNPV